MPLIARQRSRLAVLAVLALVGSLLAVSAVPVAADDGKAAHPATYSACVGDATEDAGFTDMEGSYAADAANCLAHYGITQGTTTTTYSPSKPVTRTQMALFLARAAGPAGIDLGTPEDQGLTDLDGTSDEARNAINQVVKEGIMDAPGNEFAGVTHVTREEMAVHLDQFLSHGFVGNAKDIDPGHKYTDIKGHKDLDTILTDLGTVTYSAYGAIQRLYDLGVTEGNTKTTYNPTGLVSRAQMAAFITRTLAHTNARPAGLTVQANTLDIFTDGTAMFVASVRDANHNPVVDASIDMFHIAVGDDEAFDDDGKCNTGAKGVTGTSPCKIGFDDEQTNAHGNTPMDSLTYDGETYDGAKDATVWFWTGDVGDEYDNDETTTVTHTINVSPAAANIQVTMTHGAGNEVAGNEPGPNFGEHAKFGETATITIRLVDGAGEPVAQSGKTVTVKVETTHADDSKAEMSSDRKTDEDGTIEIPFTEVDSDSDKGDSATVTVTVSRSSGADAAAGAFKNAKNDPFDNTDDDASSVRVDLQWSDADAKPTSIALSSSHDYVKLPKVDSGSTSVSINVTAVVKDQYGDPVRNTPVYLLSSGEGDHTDRPRSGGRFPVTLTVEPGDEGAVEHFAAIHVVNLDTDGDNEDDAVGDIVKGTDKRASVETSVSTLTVSDTPGATVHWATEAGETGNGTVGIADTDENIIVTTGTSMYVEYDADDQFTIGTGAVTLAVFEKALSAGDGITWDLSGEEDEVGPAKFTLTDNDAA